MKRPARVLWEKSLAGKTLPVEIPLPVEDAHHLCRVMRLRAGAAVDLIDSQGALCRSELRFDKGGGPSLLVHERVLPPGTGAATCSITVFQAPPKAGKLDPFLRAMAEAGANQLVPIQTARSVVPVQTPGFEKIRQRWQKIAQESCKQSGRITPLRIAAPLDYQAALEQISEFDRAYFLKPKAGSQALDFGAQCLRIAILIGPEGGLTAAEEGEALTKGWQALEINPAILRCETAGLVAVGILQFVLNYGCKTP